MFRSLDDLDQVVGPAAVGDELLLFETKLLERGRIAGICIEIALLQRVKERQLLLRFRRLRTRNQRHQVRQGDQNQYADNYQYNQEFRKRKGTKSRINKGRGTHHSFGFFYKAKL